MSKVTALSFQPEATLTVFCVCADLLRIGRPIKDIIIIDNSPASYAFQPENAVPIESWFDDPQDLQLMELMGLLNELAKVDNVVDLLEKAF